MKQYSFLQEGYFDHIWKYPKNFINKDIIHNNIDSKAFEDRVKNNPLTAKHNIAMARDVAHAGVDTIDGAYKGYITGSRIGQLAGGAGGAYLGHKIVNGITGRGKRDIIKNIVINSDTPEEAIEMLKICGVGKALDYAKMIEKIKSNSNWKQKILKRINITNGVATGTGSVGGAVAGAAVGQALGGATGAYFGAKKPYKHTQDVLKKHGMI